MPEQPAATSLDSKRPPCRCEPWAQRWRADRPELCRNCGGVFAPSTVPARIPTKEEIASFQAARIEREIIFGAESDA